MDETTNKLKYHMIRTDEEIIKMADRLSHLEGSSLNYKFDIDKLQANSRNNLESIRKSQIHIS